MSVIEKTAPKTQEIATKSPLGGRPSDFQAKYCGQATRLCLLGATDEEMAAFFGVATSTFYLWQRKHPEFRTAVKDGKLVADAAVAESLYKRALGYSHKAVKIVAEAKTGTQHIVPYTEQYPPD